MNREKINCTTIGSDKCGGIYEVKSESLGTVVIHLTQQAYVDRYRQYCARFIATKTDDKDFELGGEMVWEITDMEAFEDGDESNCCDWDNPLRIEFDNNTVMFR